jgi:hypothetical protein
VLLIQELEHSLSKTSLTDVSAKNSFFVSNFPAAKFGKKRRASASSVLAPPWNTAASISRDLLFVYAR